MANIKKLHENGWSRPGDWFDLVLTGIGFVPGVGDAVKAIGRGAKGAIKKGVKWIAKGGRALWAKFGRQLPALLKGLKRFGSTLLKGVASAGRKLVGKAGSFVKGLVGRAKGLVKRAGDFAGKVGERASAIARGIGDAARGAASKARGLIGKLAGALPGPVRSVFNAITGAVSRGVKAAADGLKRARDVVRGLKKKATDFLKKAGKSAADMARKVRDRVSKMRQTASKWIREKTTWVKNKVAQVRKAGISGVAKWLGGKAKAVKDRVVNAVKSGVRKARDRVRKWLDDLTGKRTPTREERLDELSKDHIDHGGKATKGTIEEAEAALAAEGKPPIKGKLRRPQPGEGLKGDFVDEAGQVFDVKAPRSGDLLREEIKENARKAGKPEPKLDPNKPIKGEFKLKTTIDAIRGEIADGEKVILDTRFLNGKDLEDLKRALQDPANNIPPGHVVFSP